MANLFDQIPIPPPLASLDKPKKRARNREALSTGEIRAGQKKLMDMVEAAFTTLETAMEEADFGNAIKAAQIILDRTGFGPKSTVDVNSVHIDLTNLTNEQLSQRAAELATKFKQIHLPEINVTPVTVQ